MLRETEKRSGVCTVQVILFFTKQLCILHGYCHVTVQPRATFQYAGKFHFKWLWKTSHSIWHFQDTRPKRESDVFKIFHTSLRCDHNARFYYRCKPREYDSFHWSDYKSLTSRTAWSASLRCLTAPLSSFWSIIKGHFVNTWQDTDPKIRHINRCCGVQYPVYQDLFICQFAPIINSHPSLQQLINSKKWYFLISAAVRIWGKAQLLPARP